MSEMTFDQHSLFLEVTMKFFKNNLYHTNTACSVFLGITIMNKFEIITRSKRFLFLMFENPIKGGEVNGISFTYSTFEFVG
jgi:hypothetical protein